MGRAEIVPYLIIGVLRTPAPSNLLEVSARAVVHRSDFQALDPNTISTALIAVSRRAPEEKLLHNRAGRFRYLDITFPEHSISRHEGEGVGQAMGK